MADPNRDFWVQRIEKTKTLIETYEDAVTALSGSGGAAGGITSYTLDTGQSRQTVTRADLTKLYDSLDTLYNRLATLEARVYGRTMTARPAW